MVTILLFGRWIADRPDRSELGSRTAQVRFERVSFGSDSFSPLQLAGAWMLTGDDLRIGGVSALSIDGDALVALTDSGVIVRFAKPARATETASIRELPDGPPDPQYKSSRDSEGLLRDPVGRGWWVAFENRNQIWLYDPQFKRALGRIDFGRARWPRNRGIEGLASEGDSLLLFPERGRDIVEIRGSTARAFGISDQAGWISDSTHLPTGELLVVNRHPTAFGFSNSLALLQRTATGFRYGRRVRLGLSPLDNVEALASERLPDGRTRLWLMTDDNFQRPLRTLLIALDWPRRPAR